MTSLVVCVWVVLSAKTGARCVHIILVKLFQLSWDMLGLLRICIFILILLRHGYHKKFVFLFYFILYLQKNISNNKRIESFFFNVTILIFYKVRARFVKQSKIKFCSLILIFFLIFVKCLEFVTKLRYLSYAVLTMKKKTGHTLHKNPIRSKLWFWTSILFWSCP